MSTIEVLSAGRFDLPVDLGRPGRGAFGVPAGGAADGRALALANRLVGNPESACGLEILLSGPRLRFPRGGVVALAGSRFNAHREHGAVTWHETLILRPGETLSLGHATDGCRCWLAVRGGLALPPLLGSRSAFTPGGWGGLAGRALTAGDRLPLGHAHSGLRCLRAAPEPPDSAAPLRVIPGPQVARFPDAGLAAFFSGAFRVAPASDRRGLRLTGPRVEWDCGELASQPVVPGCVQIPPDGAPIVLGWDGPVTGGYPVIASVIEADLARLAQLKPGDPVRFVTTTLAAARAAWAEPPVFALE